MIDEPRGVRQTKASAQHLISRGVNHNSRGRLMRPPALWLVEAAERRRVQHTLIVGREAIEMTTIIRRQRRDERRLPHRIEAVLAVDQRNVRKSRIDAEQALARDRQIVDRAFAGEEGHARRIKCVMIQGDRDARTLTWGNRKKQ